MLEFNDSTPILAAYFAQRDRLFRSIVTAV